MTAPGCLNAALFGGKPPISAQYDFGLISGANASAYSVSGTLSDGDWVIIHAHSGNSDGTITALTLDSGGGPVSYLANLIFGGVGESWYFAPHPGAGAATAAFSCTGSGNNNGSIAVYSLTGTPYLWTPFDTDVDELTGTIDCPKGGVIFIGAKDSSGGADTCTVAGINVVDLSTGAGGDATSYLFGHINNDDTNFPTLGAVNIPYLLGSNGSRSVISLY